MMHVRTGASVVAEAAAAIVLVGCGSGGPDTSCSPIHEFSNTYGTVSIQQRGPGYGLQWGAYPTRQLPGTYTAQVLINGRRYDAKTQTYPPHGSINAGAVSTGDIVRLEGSFVGSGHNQSLWLECRSA
jgi:hypothetical protein